MFPTGKPVTVLRGAGFDSYGDPTPPTSVHVVEHCAWAPRTQGAGPSSGSVDQRGRQGVIEGLTLYAPTSADITHTDRVILGHRVALADIDSHEQWEVQGEAGDWWSPFTGWAPGMEVAIRRAEG